MIHPNVVSYHPIQLLASPLYDHFPPKPLLNSFAALFPPFKPRFLTIKPNRWTCPPKLAWYVYIQSVGNMEISQYLVCCKIVFPKFRFVIMFPLIYQFPDKLISDYCLYKALHPLHYYILPKYMLQNPLHTKSSYKITYISLC